MALYIKAAAVEGMEITVRLISVTANPAISSKVLHLSSPVPSSAEIKRCGKSTLLLCSEKMIARIQSRIYNVYTKGGEKYADAGKNMG